MKLLRFEKGTRFKSQINYTDFNCLHTHDFWEFLLIFDGSYLHRVNDQNVTLQKNALCVIRPTDKHAMQALKETVGELNLQVSDDTVRNVFSSLSPDLYLSLQAPSYVQFYIPERSKQALMSLAHKQQSETTEQSEKELILSQMFIAVTQEILAHYRNAEETENENIPENVSKIITLLNAKENVTKNLQELLAPMRYSYVHLSRLFKKHMGVTLSQYFTSVKLTHARILLEETDMRVLDVALSVGYFSYPHFNTSFLKRFGVSPSKYRKNWKHYYTSLEKNPSN